LEHNPDAMLAEVEFDTVAERVRAEDLARTKTALVSEIALPGADRKAIGIAIRETNSALAALLQPVAEDLRRALEVARTERDASAVLTDRTYPYCLWDPREVLDKVR
jgi:DNA-binding ferritin-like protein